MVREARAQDVDGIARVHVRSWQGAYRGLMPQEHLDGLRASDRVPAWQRAVKAADPSRNGLFVAELDGEITGFASVGPCREPDLGTVRTGELWAIYLDPASWGRGLGRKLMTAAIGRLTQAGYRDAILWVLDTNARARRFYELSGWTPDGAAKPYEVGGAVVTEIRYHRDLSPGAS